MRSVLIKAIKWKLLELEERMRIITDIGGTPGDVLKTDVLKLKIELIELTACFTCGYNPCMCDQS